MSDHKSGDVSLRIQSCFALREVERFGIALKAAVVAWRNGHLLHTALNTFLLDVDRLGF